MNQREDDVAMLGKLLEIEELPDGEREAFADMLEQLQDGERYVLSSKQRDWARAVLEKHAPQYENAWSAGRVPRGREVETPAVLRNLPKSPPRRPFGKE